MPRLSVTLGLLATTALTAQAQCPDGTPPPCRARPAAAAPAPAHRRADPPLDADTWIVLPFDNLAKAPDVDWLRDASVNLLYLDLSKWHDIKVVDDERVSDLLRDTPGAQDGKQLSLTAGIAVAKRAGAGKLVMGDLLRVGTRTTMTAKVFDVRGGQRIRTTQQEAPVQDSLMPAFGRLARGILNVAPPAGANVGEIGTTNTTAYRDYLAGVNALNRFDLKTARSNFEGALKQDSTFALAHYKLAVLIGWENPNDDAKSDHAKAAARFSGALPPRERALVTALVAFDNQEYGRACAAYGSLVKADSTDIEALYGMGECLWHDNVVEAVGGDTTRLRYRGSWNSAIRVFKRALALDPTYHLAFQHILDSYVAEGRTGCRLKDTTALKVQSLNSSCADSYQTAIRRQGDSLLMVPVPSRNVVALAADVLEARRTNARRQNITKAREVADEWVLSGPTEARAVATLGRIDALLGNLELADAELSKVRPGDLGDIEVGRLFLLRAELALKLGHEADFVRSIDSNATTHSTGQSASYTAIGLATLGRMAMLDSFIATQIRRGGAAPPAVVFDYFREGPRVVLGLWRDASVAAERGLFDIVAVSPNPANGGTRSATGQVAATLMFGLRLPRTTWPAIEPLGDSRLAPALALAKHDTAAFRAAIASLDSAAKMAADSATADDGSSLIAVDGYMTLGDSVAALAALRRASGAGMKATPLFSQISGGFVFGVFLWPKTLLLRADLEAAKGDKDEARRYYRRFLTLWTKVDPEFQPMVDRARKALAALGPG